MWQTTKEGIQDIQTSRKAKQTERTNYRKTEVHNMKKTDRHTDIQKIQTENKPTQYIKTYRHT